MSAVTGAGDAATRSELKDLDKHVALAEDHRRVEAERWRSVGMNVFSYCAGAVGLLMLVLLPPQLDFRWSVVLPVFFVAVFLAVTQRPTQAAGKSYAPVTAVVAASAIVFGYWTILLVLVSFAAVRLRMGSREAPLRELLSPLSIGQAGAGIIATYGMVNAWSGTLWLEKVAPPWSLPIVVLLGVLAAGLIWQIALHGYAQTIYSFTGKAVYSLQFLRLGIFASFYGYLLVAVYSFGGLLTASLFYALVAQPRIVQDLLGLAKRMHQFDHARDQAISLMREMIRFTDVPNVQFTNDVENIAQMLARHMGLSKKETAEVGLAAQLHEIGKSRLPARFRWGANANAAEEAQRRTYPRLGAIMLRNADAIVDPEIADFIEYHTEHYDGSGYPRGLAGELIPPASRIIAVARAYVCMLTGYGESEKVGKAEALRLLKEQSGTLYDPRVVELLTELVN